MAALPRELDEQVQHVSGVGGGARTPPSATLCKQCQRPIARRSTSFGLCLRSGFCSHECEALFPSMLVASSSPLSFESRPSTKIYMRAPLATRPQLEQPSSSPPAWTKTKQEPIPLKRPIPKLFQMCIQKLIDSDNSLSDLSG